MSSPAPPSRNASRNSRRSTSLNFLRRSKSNDLMGERKTSGGKLTRRRQKELEEENSKDLKDLGRSPPRLPQVSPQPMMHAFGDTGSKQDKARNEIPPVPPVPASAEFVDPYARSESMTHRGRYSYANSTVSTLNSPRRVRRRRDPTPYNILIIGAKNSGKTSFLNFLKQTLELPPKKQPHRDAVNDTPPPSARSNRNYTHQYQEIEIDNERIGLTLWDSQGLEKNVVDLQLREMSNFVESKFEDTFVEEMKVVRAPGARDTHIHCVFFVLDPARLDSHILAQQLKSADGAVDKVERPSKMVGGLDEDFDLQVLRTLQGKTTVVPIISKADTVTTAHMAFLKQAVRESLRKGGLLPLEALNLGSEDGDDDPNKLDERDEEAENQTSTVGGAHDNEPRHSIHSEDSDTLPENERLLNRKVQRSGKRQSANMASSNSILDSGYVPLSILSPDSHSLVSNDGPLGRKFPWGFADPHNSEHCDFGKLKEACFSDWRADFREASREVFYERWRTSRLNRQDTTVNGTRAGNTMEARKISGGIPQGILRPKNR